MSNIPSRLKELRQQNSLTQAEVAQRLKSTPALISAYENAERYPSLEKLILLADIYHTSTDYILGRSYNSDNRVLIDVTELSEQQRFIIQNLIKDMQNYSTTKK